MKTRSAAVLVTLMMLLCALALAPVTAASAGTPGGPRTWHVLVGGQSADQAVQAEGYYPHVITIDAGDTVTWTLNTVQLVGVTFTGTGADLSSSCTPPDCVTIFSEGLQDSSPCGPPSYDGVTTLDQSGMMVRPATIQVVPANRATPEQGDLRVSSGTASASAGVGCLDRAAPHPHTA